MKDYLTYNLTSFKQNHRQLPSPILFIQIRSLTDSKKIGNMISFIPHPTKESKH